jgi:quercetin dioxygenase-like cupin family protein
MSQATFYRWFDMPQVEMTPKIRRRLVAGEKVMLTEFHLDKGAVVAEHHHHHEQVCQILSGKLEFTVGGQKRVVGPGEVLHIPSNLPHSAVALESSVVNDIFSPPREDFLTDAPTDYM